MTLHLLCLGFAVVVAAAFAWSDVLFDACAVTLGLVVVEVGAVVDAGVAVVAVALDGAGEAVLGDVATTSLVDDPP